MPTGRTDELTRRFGAEIADAISRAYEAAVFAARGHDGTIKLSTEQRIHLVEILMRVAPSDPEELKGIALSFVSQHLRDTG